MIEVDDLSVSFGEREVFDHLSLCVEPGELVAIIGENGCGKSTLGRLMCGALLAQAGRVTVDGVDPAQGDAERLLVRRSVGLVQQDPLDQIVSSVVFDEVAFGPRNLGLDETVVAERVSEALAAVRLGGLESRGTTALSGGEQQRLAIAGVLAMHPRYIVFDEATSQLDPEARSVMRDLFVELAHEQGLGVILVTHDRSEIALCDRVVDVGHGALRDAEPCFGPFDGEAGLRPERSTTPLPSGALPALELQDVSHSIDGTPILDRVSLRVMPGEIVLLRGKSGVGKSTLASIAAGLRSADEGRVLAGGRCVRPLAVGLAFQNPESQFFLDTVHDELAFAPRNEGLAEGEVEKRVGAAVASAGIDADLMTRYPFELSGGQARRVALGSVLTIGAAAYVFDEPTAGLDDPGRRACHAIMRDLASRGAGVLVISHDIEEWERVADEVVELSGGRVRAVPHGARSGLQSPPEASERPRDMLGASAQNIPQNASGDAVEPSGAPVGHGRAMLPMAVDARVKIALLLAMTLAIFTASTPLPMGCWFVAALALASLSGVGVGGVARGMKPVVFILAFTLLANLVACDGGGDIALAGPVGISIAGAQRGLLAVMRIAVLVALSLIMARMTKPAEVGDACVRLMRPLSRLRVPVAQIGASIEVALRFLPIVSEELARIRLAQRARGVRFDDGPLFGRVRAWASVFTPLIVGLFRRADTLAESMAARCYDMEAGRLPEPRPLRTFDRIVLACGTVVVLALGALGMFA